MKNSRFSSCDQFPPQKNSLRWSIELYLMSDIMCDISNSAIFSGLLWQSFQLLRTSGGLNSRKIITQHQKRSL